MSETAEAAAGAANTGEDIAPDAGEQKTGGKIAPDAGEKSREAIKETPAQRRARFDALIGEGGEFADFYREAQQKAVNGGIARGKAALEKAMKAQQPVLDLLMARYGTKDLGQLQEAINKDASWWQSYASSRGISEQQARAQIAMQAELDALRRRSAAEEGERRARAQMEQWNHQAQEVQAVYPEFDLRAAVQNTDFLSMLKSGVSMRVAYEVAHMEDIKHSIAHRATRDAEARLTESIRAGGSRPVEGGVGGQPGAVTKVDPGKLSKQEMDKIMARVARGERVTFE